MCTLNTRSGTPPTVHLMCRTYCGQGGSEGCGAVALALRAHAALRMPLLQSAHTPCRDTFGASTVWAPRGTAAAPLLHLSPWPVPRAAARPGSGQAGHRAPPPLHAPPPPNPALLCRRTCFHSNMVKQPHQSGGGGVKPYDLSQPCWLSTLQQRCVISCATQKQERRVGGVQGVCRGCAAADTHTALLLPPSLPPCLEENEVGAGALFHHNHATHRFHALPGLHSRAPAARRGNGSSSANLVAAARCCAGAAALLPSPFETEQRATCWHAPDVEE